MTGATLAFDTSGPQCRAALVVAREVVVQRHEDLARGQAERLFPLLEEVLAEAGIVWGDIARLGVGIGPGNFTGIRIAVSAARGLALSLDRPAIGISTLEALALDLPYPVVACVAGRRETIYVQRFLDTETMAPEMIAAPALRLLGLPPATLCVGDAAEAVAAATGSHPTPPAYPLAVAIGLLAERRAGSASDRPTPLYLRPADAAPPRDSGPRKL